MADNSPRECREFIESMTSEDVRRYAGQWIAVASGEIVAHGKDPGSVLDEGRKAGKGQPYMRYMYAGPEEVPFLYRPP